jgi:hypothetical protein
MALLAAVALAVTCQAAVSPQGPFTGSQQENFESFNPSSTVNILGNTAVMTALNGGTVRRTTGISSNCGLNGHPSGGNLCYNSSGGYDIVFNQEASDIGFYYGTVHTQSINGNTILFFNAANQQIGSESISTGGQCGRWTWNGWSTDEGIKRVRITSGWTDGSGRYALLDNMEASYDPIGGAVPASSTTTLLVTMALLTAGLVIFAGRGRV